MNQLVFQSNNQVVTSSRNVARDLSKRHDHVTRDVDEINKGLPKNGDTQRMFYETTYVHEQLSRKAFSEFWRDFKNHFNLPRYGDLPKKQFGDALRFIGMWQPSTGLRIEIDNANNQQRMRVV